MQNKLNIFCNVLCILMSPIFHILHIFDYPNKCWEFYQVFKFESPFGEVVLDLEKGDPGSNLPSSMEASLVCSFFLSPKWEVKKHPESRQEENQD